MSRRQSPFPKKPLPIKRNDGEPLTRVDLQYDFLTHVFADTNQVFGDPHWTIKGSPPGTRVSFRDLYVNTILHSPKATKSLKDSITTNPEFATDFAMLALLTNVGRVHTTMSFFAEKKTAVRTYHPIPALERVEGNMQDAPRIKALLKACMLPAEDPRNVLSTPSEILARARSGVVPPTSMPNIIFVLTNHSPAIAEEHFLHEIEFIDLFLPLEISSYSRARAFLWLCYHYHEATSVTSDDDYDTQIQRPNPFCDAHRPGKAPAFVMLTRGEAERENVDTEEEVCRADNLIKRRNEVVNKITRFMTVQPGPSEDGSMPVKKARTPARPNLTPQEKKERKALWDKQYRERQKEKALLEKKEQAAQGIEVKSARQVRRKATSKKEGTPVAESMSASTSHSQDALDPSYISSQYAPGPSGRHDPYNQSSDYPNSKHEDIHASDEPHIPRRSQRRYAPYKSASVGDLRSQRVGHTRTPVLSVMPKTMLEHTWHIINCSDPLLDSDEESDMHVHNDYTQRLRIIARLRGKEPTPEPESKPNEDSPSRSQSQSLHHPHPRP